MNPLGQVVAVKTDPIAILDEHRRHVEEEVSLSLRNRSIRKTSRRALLEIWKSEMDLTRPTAWVCSAPRIRKQSFYGKTDS
jgi:hypothetical protein